LTGTGRFFFKIILQFSIHKSFFSSHSPRFTVRHIIFSLEAISIEQEDFMVKPIPDGYSSVTPYLVLDDANAAIEFYKKAFGAKELFRMPMGKRIGHAELQIGNSRIMLADEDPQRELHSARHYHGSPMSLMLYVEDVDAVAEKAAAAGAAIQRPVQNQFYGDRSGTFVDPFGFQWTVGTHVEDVSHEEMERRMSKMVAAD
jgi:PhnB protein